MRIQAETRCKDDGRSDGIKIVQSYELNDRQKDDCDDELRRKSQRQDTNSIAKASYFQTGESFGVIARFLGEDREREQAKFDGKRWRERDSEEEQGTFDWERV